jgi:hypothetical protein
MQMILDSARFARASGNSGPRGERASEAATSPPQSRKLSLTNGLHRTVFRGPYPYCAKVERSRLTPIAIKAAKPYIQAHSRLSLPLQFRPNSLFPGTRKIRI